MVIEVPGDAMASQQEVARQMMRAGEALALLDRLAVSLRSEEVMSLTGFSVRFPPGTGAEYLITVRARVDDAPFVAFHSAYTLGEALRGMYHRLKGSTLKWRSDEYGK